MSARRWLLVILAATMGFAPSACKSSEPSPVVTPSLFGALATDLTGAGFIMRSSGTFDGVYQQIWTSSSEFPAVHLSDKMFGNGILTIESIDVDPTAGYTNFWCSPISTSSPGVLGDVLKGCETLRSEVENGTATPEESAALNNVFTVSDLDIGVIAFMSE